MRKTRNSDRTRLLEYDGPLGQVLHNDESFFASKYGIRVGTYDTFREAILALLEDGGEKVRFGQFRVVVGEAEMIYDGESEMEARRQYRDFVILSTGESVALFRDYEVIRVYQPA
jgi:hypothetical protein